MKKYLMLVLSLLVIADLAILTFGHRRPPKAVSGVATQATTPAPIVEKETIPQGIFYAPILAYHHIALRRPQNSYYVSPEIFDLQLKWLKDNGYHIISFDTFYQAAIGQGALPIKPAVLTFDDGNIDQYTNAFPILKKYGATATFFIKINNADKRKGGMSFEILKELIEAGNIIGSHSVNHKNMAKMTDSQLKYELEESKRILEENLNIKIKYFCYPGGAYSKKTIKAVKKAGYLAAVTTKHKVYQEIKDEDSLYTLPRVHIDDEMSTFTQWVQGINLY